jgi:TonB-linked SusC/RagA family outer membrane protein
MVRDKLQRGFKNRIRALSWMGLIAILIFPFSINASDVGKHDLLFQQVNEQHTVNGVVTSSDEGQRLPGVNIRVKNTSVGTSTNANGEFTLNAPSESDTLVFSFVGFRSQEIPINERSTINVQMEPETVEGEELVVVGYGQQRQEEVTGSVASISEDEVSEVPASDITEALKGRLPGIEISQTSSQPGSPMQIRIRGTRSLTASNDPLVVLNGTPFSGSLNDIAPSQIESIDILKDASATAIYGSRGANGVILVQTKGGEQGQEAQVTYNSYGGVKKVFSQYPMMSGSEFSELREAAGQATMGADEAEGVNTNWQDLFYRNGIEMNHELNVSGGTEGGSYYFGLGYSEDQAVIPTQQYKRYSLNGSINQGVGEHFRFGLNTNTNYNISEGNQVGLYGVLTSSPLASPYAEDGSLRRTIRMPEDENYVLTQSVVERLDERWVDEDKSFGTYNSLFGEVEVPWVEGLKYRINLGLNYSQNSDGSFTGQGVNSSTATTPSTASIGNSHRLNWLVENIITYDRTFNEKHSLNLTALYSAERTRYNSSSVSARDIPNEAFQYYNLGRADGEVVVDPANQNFEDSGLESYMGRVIYGYDERYLLTATLRTDGSSRLAEGNKWHTYPAVSVGWNIANEAFMEDVDLVNSLKLRVGYGQTSNQAIAPYSTLGQLASRPYNFGPDDYATGFYVDGLPNPNLGWEYSETWNYGLDFTVLNNRLSGTLEYYSTNTSDILLGVNLPNTSGVSSYTNNVGKTQNKGLELSLQGTILQDRNGWTWEAGLNIYGNRNELVELASGQQRDEGNNWFVGNSINVIYDYKREGLWQEDDPYLDILEPGGNVGMIKVEYTGEYDDNGEPVRAIGPEDRQARSINPDLQGGFNTRVAYKGFDFNTVAAFQRGGILISTLYGSAGYLNMLDGRRGNVDVDYWTANNTDARYPKPGGITSGDNPKYASTLGYFDASYLKIRTMTLGYTFSQNNWLKKTGIRNLRLYATVENPFVLFSPFNRKTGLDPQTNSLGDQNSAVESYNSRLLTLGFNTPSTRNFLLGINLSF